MKIFYVQREGEDYMKTKYVKRSSMEEDKVNDIRHVVTPRLGLGDC